MSHGAVKGLLSEADMVEEEKRCSGWEPTLYSVSAAAAAPAAAFGAHACALLQMKAATLKLRKSINSIEKALL